MRAWHRLAARPGSRHGNTPSLEGLLGVVRAHHPAADLASIELAHEEAARWHAGQTRRSGDPYLTHCLAVARIVADVGMPPTVVCAALLHDVIEDTLCPPSRLAGQFGLSVAQLVADVSTVDLRAIPPDTALRSARPPHSEAVLVIRLADRLHNMRTIEFVAAAKQYGKARETIEVGCSSSRGTLLIRRQRSVVQDLLCCSSAAGVPDQNMT